jgi:hypothetical protein
VRNKLTQHPELSELFDAFHPGSPLQNGTIREHVAACPACRQKVDAFWVDAEFVMAQIAPKVTHNTSRADDDWNWDAEEAERRAIENTFAHTAVVDIEKISFQLDESEQSLALPRSMARKKGRTDSVSRVLPAEFKKVYLPAAGVLLALTSGVCGYWFGAKKTIVPPSAPSASIPAVPKAPEVDVQALANDRAELKRQLAEREAKMAALTQSIKQERTEIDQLNETQLKLEAAAQDATSTKEALASEKEALRAKLQAAQANLAIMQADLSSAVERNKTLTAGLNERDSAIRAKDDTIQQQKELLDSDRDVRDLITARNLYVAEVMDLDKKPYARVFFTKDKSLIFYGYDLDKEPGVRNASTFQAWGNRGHNRENALNLGFLYQDSVANKRWVLKLDDPKTLTQIDAIFITVEPKNGSPKPTGKSVLFASLRLPPNHP